MANATLKVQNQPVNEQLTALLEAQQEVSTHESLSRQILSTIARNEKDLADLRRVDSELPTLNSRREGILADIAIGNGSQQKLTQIDQAITTEQEALATLSTKNTPKIKDLEATISGLKRKVNDLECQRPPLNHKLGRAKAAFIKSEAERIGGEYVTVAKDTLSKMRQLIALSNIYDKCREHEPAFASGNEFQFISLPSFRLEALKEHSHGSMGWLLEEVVLTSNYPEKYIKTDMEAELERLISVGVEL